MQVNYELVRRVRVGGARAGDGRNGMVPAKPGPRAAHKLTDEVVAFARSTREQDPSTTVVRLAAAIAEEFGITVHPRSVERALARDRNSKSAGEQ